MYVQALRAKMIAAIEDEDVEALEDTIPVRVSHTSIIIIIIYLTLTLPSPSLVQERRAKEEANRIAALR